MLRYLRIAGSVLSIVACMLLTAVWVRSLYRGDLVYGRVLFAPFEIISVEGRLKITWLETRAGTPKGPCWGVQVNSFKADDNETSTMVAHIRRFANRRGFGFEQHGSLAILVPHSFLVLVTGTLAAGLGIRRRQRFSLRTLLIALTLIGAFLGMIAISD